MIKSIDSTIKDVLAIKQLQVENGDTYTIVCQVQKSDKSYFVKDQNGSFRVIRLVDANVQIQDFKYDLLDELSVAAADGTDIISDVFYRNVSGVGDCLFIEWMSDGDIKCTVLPAGAPVDFRANEQSTIYLDCSDYWF